MIKSLEAFNNILAEGDFRYFSSLYDRDMFKEDVIAVKKALETLEIIRKNIKIKVDYSIGVNRNSYFIETQEDVIPITEEEYYLLKEILK